MVEGSGLVLILSGIKDLYKELIIKVINMFIICWKYWLRGFGIFLNGNFNDFSLFELFI